MGRTGDVEVEAVQSLAQKFIEGKAGARGGVVGGTIQRHVDVTDEFHVGTGTGTAGLDANEAQFGAGFNVRGTQTEAGAGGQIVDGQGKFLTDTDDDVQPGTQVNPNLAHAADGQIQVFPVTQLQADLVLEAQLVGETYRHRDFSPYRIVAGLLIAQEARGIQGINEFAHGADLDRFDVHPIGDRIGVIRPLAGDGQAAAIGRHGLDWMGYRADRHPSINHGGSELSRFAGQLVAIGVENRATAGFGLGCFAQGRRPGCTWFVEINPVNHFTLEGGSQIQHLINRLLKERQFTQSQTLGINAFQIIQYIGQGHDDVFGPDLGKPVKLIHVEGLHVQFAKGIALDTDRRHQTALTHQFYTGYRGIERQIHIHLVFAGIDIHLEYAVNIGQPTGQRSCQCSPLPFFARSILASHAHRQRTETGLHHHVLCRNGTVKAELAHVEAGIESFSPVQTEVKVQCGLEAGTHRQRGVQL